MRAKRLVAGALAGAVALTVVGGCAAQQAQALEPKLELRAAAQQLAAAQQAAFSLKLTGTPDDLIAAVKLEAAKDKSGDQPDAQDEAILRKLFTSSLTIAYDKAGAGAADDRSAIAADIDGITGTELRYLDGVLYAKAPVNDLAAKFGASPADLKALSTNVAGKVAGVDDFLAGKWVSLDVKKLTELAGAGAGLPTETLDQQ
ncbi:MAG TPA: hypothetical protein VFO77_08305, partial [Actinoplanes sp.]|nr:hypothetical protein [Actinoplanes sp.]